MFKVYKRSLIDFWYLNYKWDLIAKEEASRDDLDQDAHMKAGIVLKEDLLDIEVTEIVKIVKVEEKPGDSVIMIEVADLPEEAIGWLKNTTKRVPQKTKIK